MKRQALQSIIEDCYSARLAGDAAKLDKLFADTARYKVVGAKHLIDGYRAAHLAAMRPAVEEIMKLVTMHSADPIAVLIDGNRAAVRLRATLSIGGREPYETELGHWWEFDETGLVLSLTEYVDTAMLREEMAAM